MYDFESEMSKEEKDKVMSILEKIPVPTTINEFLNLIDKAYEHHTALIK